LTNDNENPTFTRRIDGNECIRVGEELRDLTGADCGDYVTFTVESTHPKEEQHG
jgi:hypothetical protein